jgi:hypothetical protein
MFGIFNLPTVNSSDFVDAAKCALGPIWKPELTRPTESFYSICKSEVIKNSGKSEIETVFEGIKYKLLQCWNAQIIEKSNGFKKVKVDK